MQVRAGAGQVRHHSHLGGAAEGPQQNATCMPWDGRGRLPLGLAAVATAPAADAYPGDPSPGCEGQVFAKYCDGRIRPDGTFKRCTTTCSPFTYVCQIIDNNAPFPPIPLGQPDHHID